MTFDIREFSDRLEPSPKKGKFICPVCGGGSLDVNKKNGAYRCFSNECESADIRQAIAPLEEPIQPKAKRTPKKKAEPVTVNVLPTVGTLPDNRTYPQKIRTWDGYETRYFYPSSDPNVTLFTKRIDYDDPEKDKFVRPFFEIGGLSTMGKGDRPWDAYRLHEALEFAAGNWVCVVEGEKTVEAMRYLGIPAITFQGASWTAKDFGAAIAKLKGKIQGMLIIPDHDDAGYLKGDKLLESCASHGYPALLINPLDIWGNMPDNGGDVADWIKADKPDPSVARGLIEWAIAKAFENQHYKQKLETVQEIVKSKDLESAEIIAKTTTAIAPVQTYIDAKNPDEGLDDEPQKEAMRLYGGYKNLSVKELTEYLEEAIGDRLKFDDLEYAIYLDDEKVEIGEEIEFWFFDKFGETSTKNRLDGGLTFQAKKNSFNPVVNYLNQCHAKSERVAIDNLAERYFGQSTKIFNRMVEMWLISAVARMMDPGVKVDHALTLQSKQGKYKSTFFNTLGGGWFTDSVKDLESKDTLLTLHRSWIIELGELDKITSKKQAGVIKHFLTQRIDNFRLPYGRRPTDNKRRGVFCATVNPSKFLVDDENRRFWVVPVSEELTGKIDIERLAKERDGIWAAAVDAYIAGAKWYPTTEEEEMIKAVNEEFTALDPWQETVEEWIKDLPYVCAHQILIHCFEFQEKDVARPIEMRITKILERLGWTKDGRRSIGGAYRRVRFNPNLTIEDTESNKFEELQARYQQPNNHAAAVAEKNDHLDYQPNTNLDGRGWSNGQSNVAQGFECYQPIDQPYSRSVVIEKEEGRYIPTSTELVGIGQSPSLSGLDQPTNENRNISQKNKKPNELFLYEIGDLLYWGKGRQSVTVADFAPIGTLRASLSYSCQCADDSLEWISQKDLKPVH